MTAGTGAFPSPSSELRCGTCPPAAGGTELLASVVAKPQYWGGTLGGHPRMLLLTASGELFIPTPEQMLQPGHSALRIPEMPWLSLAPRLRFGVPPAPFSPCGAP